MKQAGIALTRYFGLGVVRRAYQHGYTTGVGKGYPTTKASAEGGRDQVGPPPASRPLLAQREHWRSRIWTLAPSSRTHVEMPGVRFGNQGGSRRLRGGAEGIRTDGHRSLRAASSATSTRKASG